MKSDIFIFPNGGGTKILTMATVNISDNGVSVLNPRGDMVGWIECDNAKKKRQVAQLILGAVSAGKRFSQPSWDFLEESEDE